MYRQNYQSGILSIFYSVGQKPLLNWASKAQAGGIKRITDQEIRSLVLDMRASNITTTYIECPAKPHETLGIRMPIFVLLFKNVNRFFSFQIEVLDCTGFKRRFRASNFVKVTSMKQFTTSMPLVLHPGWNTVVFDLHRLLDYCYKQRLLEVNRVKIHANCRLRRVYFCDRPYSDSELPKEYKLHLMPNIGY
ncbi:unnamed protein product [Protopolystoma xenopodis]|uniref:CFA20 domain-containing protein n=1 Tax=Protopolystoma xenopodis TaxID=117903 RepID=A0A448WE59_9PLAT|nr:unnamed protein product [Protopolystoma xenopodis]